MVPNKSLDTGLCSYGQICKSSDADKDLFYDQLRVVTAKIPLSEFLVLCGYRNGHVGSTSSGFREVNGGFGYDRPEPDTEGENP